MQERLELMGGGLKGSVSMGRGNQCQRQQER